MYPTSPAYQAVVSQPHAVVSRARIQAADGTKLADLDVVSGQVTMDATAAIQRRATATLLDPTGKLVPTAATALLHPASGNELVLERGIRHSSLSGGQELIPLGVFRLSSVKLTNQGITIEGYDRARRIQRARFTNPYAVAAGTNYATAIQSLLQSRMTGVVFINRLGTPLTTPTLVFPEQEDPWKFAQQMAESVGGVVAPDGAGQFVLRPQPSPDQEPVAYYEQGATATLMGTQRSLTDEGVYNHVIVTGESPGFAPVRAEAKDDDPASPTWVGHGDVPYWFTSSFVTTYDQALSAATGLLRKVVGSAEKISFTGLVNPAHEPGDVVQVTDPQTGTAGKYIMDGFTMSLTGATMAANCRKRRTIEGG